MKLAAVTFQNLFPAINVQTTRLSACQVGSKVTYGVGRLGHCGSKRHIFVAALCRAATWASCRLLCAFLSI